MTAPTSPSARSGTDPLTAALLPVLVREGPPPIAWEALGPGLAMVKAALQERTDLAALVAAEGHGDTCPVGLALSCKACARRERPRCDYLHVECSCPHAALLREPLLLPGLCVRFFRREGDGETMADLRPCAGVVPAAWLLDAWALLGTVRHRLLHVLAQRAGVAPAASPKAEG